MKNVNIKENEMYNKVAEFFWYAVSRELTPLQRKIFTYAFINSEKSKVKNKGFNVVDIRKNYLTETLHLMGSETKFRKKIIDEMYELCGTMATFNINGTTEVKLGFFEGLQFNTRNILIKLHPSLILYFDNIKELYNKYNLQYFIFSNNTKGATLYYYLQKNGMEGFACSSAKWLKDCMYLPDDYLDNGYKFYHRFIVPAVKDINEFSIYQIINEYSYIDKISGIHLSVRKKTKNEMSCVPDLISQNHRYDGSLFFNPLF